tara:strand:+ start:610 stop:1041 length:432 start_codon:yes stop_codon:yes gene_type:complete
MVVNRIYHHWEKWECYKAGFYGSSIPIKSDEAIIAYRDFLANIPKFRGALERVLNEWTNSCDQFLSNENINRIAWLGQAAMCIDSGIPSVYRSGYKLLNSQQQAIANNTAQEFLNKWIKSKYDKQDRTQDDGIHKKMGSLRLF